MFLSSPIMPSHLKLLPSGRLDLLIDLKLGGGLLPIVFYEGVFGLRKLRIHVFSFKCTS